MILDYILLPILSSLLQELDGKVKPKKHHGKYTNYCFDKDTFLEEMKKKTQNAVVNWTKLATKYNLKSNLFENPAKSWCWN
jgi:hypothetical protein